MSQPAAVPTAAERHQRQIAKAVVLIRDSGYSPGRAADACAVGMNEVVNAAQAAGLAIRRPPPARLGPPLPGEPGGPPLSLKARPGGTAARGNTLAPTPPRPAPAPARPAERQEPDTIRVRVTDCFTDLSYQREPNDSWCLDRVRCYDPELLGVIEVSDRGPDATPRYAVIDGGNRRKLVQAVAGPDATLLAKVHVGLTVEQEAGLFYDFDAGRRRLTGWDRWKARRARGDETVAAVEAAVTAGGLALRAPNDRKGRRGAIVSTIACERLFQIGGADLVAETARLLVGAWGDGECFTGDVVEGLGLLLAHYPEGEVSRTRVLDACQSMQWRNVGHRARQLRDVGIKGAMPRLVCHQLVMLLNDRRGTHGQRLPALEPGTVRLARLEAAGRARSQRRS